MSEQKPPAAPVREGLDCSECGTDGSSGCSCKRLAEWLRKDSVEVDPAAEQELAEHIREARNIAELYRDDEASPASQTHAAAIEAVCAAAESSLTGEDTNGE